MARRGKISKEKDERYFNNKEPWSKEDIEFIMNSELKDSEIALKIGRTPASIWTMRTRIYKEKNETGDDFGRNTVD